ncbi:tubby C-terminal-like domain-containing protein [Gaertneriomyces semiglobifer]|nr:tubby C-terminal-like domain-containing protein [Gaertneriomyces semiglobifer]
MGSSSSQFENATVQAPPTPVACVDPRFCMPQSVTLHLREKIFSFSGDDFKIKDPNTDQVYFRIAGRALSLRDKKTFSDAYGEPVMNMKKELLAFIPNYNLHYGDDSKNKLAEIRAHVTLMKPRLSVSFVSKVDGTPIELGMKGDWLARRAIVWMDYGRKGKENRIIVAKVTAPVLTGRNMFFGVQDYYVTIAPGMDIALVVAICVALDERAREN